MTQAIQTQVDMAALAASFEAILAVAPEAQAQLLAAWEQVKALHSTVQQQHKALRQAEAARAAALKMVGEMQAQRDAVADEMSTLLNKIASGEILGELLRDEGLDDVGNALHELHTALRDETMDSIVAEIGQVLGPQWSPYSIRALVDLLTKETPSEWSYSRAEAFRKTLRRMFEGADQEEYV